MHGQVGSQGRQTANFDTHTQPLAPSAPAHTHKTVCFCTNQLVRIVRNASGSVCLSSHTFVGNHFYLGRMKVNKSSRKIVCPVNIEPFPKSSN